MDLETHFGAQAWVASQSAQSVCASRPIEVCRSIADGLHMLGFGPSVARFADRSVDIRETTAERELHSRDRSPYHIGLPDAVAYPTSIDEVQAVILAAAEQGLRVVPWGAGSGIEGAALAGPGGIALDTSRLDRIFSVDLASLICRVQPGVRRLALEQRLAGDGLMFPIDPGADASLGGMAATNAGGTQTARYGKVRDQILGLTAVTGEGKVIRTGAASPKTSAGYDVTSLLIGSEGSLAVITELTLRLRPIPEAATLVRASFRGIGAACAAGLDAWRTCSHEVVRVELLDLWYIDALNSEQDTGLPSADTLLIELAGSRAAVADAERDVAWILRDAGTIGVERSSQFGERQRLWRLRHHAHFAKNVHRPGVAARSTDTCVPPGALASYAEAARGWLGEYGLTGGITGHVVDGNLHVGLLFDSADGSEVDRLERFSDRLVREALNRGGTATGEHGVGVGKRAALLLEHPDLTGIYAGLKRVLDPQEVLVPGALVGGTSPRSPVACVAVDDCDQRKCSTF